MLGGGLEGREGKGKELDVECCVVLLLCCLGGGGGFGVSNGMHTGDEFFRLKFFLLGEMECILPINSLFALTILMGRRMLKVPVLEKDLACSLNFLLHIHTPLDHPWFVPIISSPLKNAKIVKYGMCSIHITGCRWQDPKTKSTVVKVRSLGGQRHYWNTRRSLKV